MSPCAPFPPSVPSWQNPTLGWVSPAALLPHPFLHLAHVGLLTWHKAHGSLPAPSSLNLCLTLRIAPRVSQRKQPSHSNPSAFCHQIYELACTGSPFPCPLVSMEGVTLYPKLIPPLCPGCFHPSPPQGPHSSHLVLFVLPLCQLFPSSTSHLGLEPVPFTVSTLSAPVLWES